MAPKKGLTVVKGSKGKTPATRTLQDVIEELPDVFLNCRDMRHAWDVHRDFFLTSDAGDVRRELLCMRCQAIRVETYQMIGTGLLKARQNYDYPAGYQLSGVVHGKRPSLVIQKEQYRRAMLRVQNAKKKTS